MQYELKVTSPYGTSISSKIEAFRDEISMKYLLEKGEWIDKADNEDFKIILSTFLKNMGCSLTNSDEPVLKIL